MKVLLATDGSTDSLRAAQFIPRLCAVQELTVTVLCVKDPYIAAFFTEGVITTPDITVADTAAADALKRTSSVLRGAGLEVQERAEWGDPARTVTEMAQKEGFDLIVCGSRGIHGIGGLLLGSVSERILRRAHCPVMVVR